MCEYCGCHQNPFLGQLMDEHDKLSSLGDSAVRALEQGDVDVAMADLAQFTALLKAHNDIEERGIFAAMRELGEFVELIDELAADHVDLHARLDGFSSPPPLDELTVLLADLADHVEKENRGVFPFAYSGFSTTEWVIVEHAHR
ncbi:MAG: hemerythrin domain-containing protein [Propionibacteriaceae bacterium]|nr:hemerythrin domain-containing protein [Propionibacteriaceae bacterium]